MKRTKLDIYSYIDYRDFLKDRLKELKAENQKFSQRYFCRRIGLASNSYLKLIIDGSRNLTERVSCKLTTALGLTKEETGFFFDLVRYSQAKTTEVKSEALEDLRRNRRFNKVHQLKLDHFDYMTDPLPLALREMIHFENFKEDPAWISSRLKFKASPEQIKQGIEKLLRLELVRRDETGALAVCYRHTATGDQLGSSTLRIYHRKMLLQAIESIEEPVSKRYFRGLTMSVPEESYTRVVEMYGDFIDKVRAEIESRENCDHVYHMEMALFPLAGPDSEAKPSGSKGTKDSKK